MLSEEISYFMDFLLCAYTNTYVPGFKGLSIKREGRTCSHKTISIIVYFMHLYLACI